MFHIAIVFTSKELRWVFEVRVKKEGRNVNEINKNSSLLPSKSFEVLKNLDSDVTKNWDSKFTIHFLFLSVANSDFKHLHFASQKLV
jgi:hypothetical protein